MGRSLGLTGQSHLVGVLQANETNQGGQCPRLSCTHVCPQVRVCLYTACVHTKVGHNRTHRNV